MEDTQLLEYEEAVRSFALRLVQAREFPGTYDTFMDLVLRIGAIHSRMHYTAKYRKAQVEDKVFKADVVAEVEQILEARTVTA